MAEPTLYLVRNSLRPELYLQRDGKRWTELPGNPDHGLRPLPALYVGELEQCVDVMVKHEYCELVNIDEVLN